VKAAAWRRYQAEKKAKQPHSVHTQDLSFDPASHTSSETIDPREVLWSQIIQTAATPHTQSQLNHLKRDGKEEPLIEYLTANLAEFGGTPEDRLEILKLTVQSWLSDHGFSDEGWNHHSRSRSSE
jgi:hypothetical protein